MFRNLYRFFSRGRLPLRTHVHQTFNGDHTVKRVRIIEPILSAGRRRSLFFYFGVAYGTFIFLPDILHYVEGKPADADSAKAGHQKSAQKIEANKKDQSKDNEEDDAQADKTMFIPLGWARQKPQQYYKASDPEWLAFVDFSRDLDKREKVQTDLALLVFDTASKNRSLGMFLGPGSRMLGRFWVDIDFPDTRPPEFERNGLEISPNGIAWTTRPVSLYNYMRLYQALVPLPLGASVYLGSFTLFAMHFERLKSLFRPYQPPSTRDQFEQELINLQRARQRAGTANAPPPSPPENPLLSPSLPPLSPSSSSSSSPTSPPSATPATPATPPSSFPKPPLQPPHHPQQDHPAHPRPPSWFTPPPSFPSSSADDDWPDSWEIANLSIEAFKRTLARTWRSVDPPPESGAFRVAGLVEIHGTDASAILDVSSMYSIEDRKFMGVRIRLKKVTPRKQFPRGGF